MRGGGGFDLQHLAAGRERRAGGVPDFLEERAADQQHQVVLGELLGDARRVEGEACRDRPGDPSGRNCGRAGPRTTPRRRCARPASSSVLAAPARATSSPATIAGFLAAMISSRHRLDARGIGAARGEDLRRACRAAHVGLLLHDVDRQRHEHRPGRRVVGDLEGALQDRPELVGALDLHAPLGDRRGHRRKIVAEHGIAQPEARVLLARRHHHRRVVLERAVDHADARCPGRARHGGSRRRSCRSPGRRSWRRRAPRPHAGARCTGVAGSRAANRAAGSRWCRGCRRCDRRRGPAASRRTPDDRALLHPSKFVAWYGKPMEVVERYRERTP